MTVELSKPETDVRARYRRVLMIEAIVAAAVNMTLGSAVTWATFGGMVLVPVWGKSGLVYDTLMSTFLPALGMVQVLTFLIRKRRKSGEFNVISNRVDPAWISRLPAHLLPRALLIAAVATLVFTGITATFASLSGLETISPWMVLMERLIHNAFFGVILAPIIVARTLAEP